MPYFICAITWAQKHSSNTPFYDRDSLYISGKVVDELGKPVENALVLFTPFYTQKWDVTWYEKDTFYTDKKGDFEVQCNRGQLNFFLFFKKPGCFISRHFLDIDSGKISIDTPIVLFSRQRHHFDSKNIGKSDIGMTIRQAITKFKIILEQSYLYTLPNSNTLVKGLTGETADSSQIVLLVNDYSESLRKKQTVLNKKIIGIGVAFADGKKRFFRNASSYAKKVYNEYYREQEDLQNK